MPDIKMNKIIHLRPHHLLCILTYVGKGYSQAFIDNFDQIIEDLNGGSSRIKLVNKPDDICAPRLCDPDDTTCHCLNDSIQHRDKDALTDLNLQNDDEIILTKSLISTLRTDYKTHKIRTACQECEWHDFCTDIAKNDFKGTKLK